MSETTNDSHQNSDNNSIYINNLGKLQIWVLYLPSFSTFTGAFCIVQNCTSGYFGYSKVKNVKLPVCENSAP